MRIFTKMKRLSLMMAALLTAGTALAQEEYGVVWSQDFENADTYAEGWTLSYLNASQRELSDGTFALNLNSNNANKGPSCSFPLSNSNFTNATDYIFEFDWAIKPSNNKESILTVYGDNDAVLFSVKNTSYAASSTIYASDGTTVLGTITHNDRQGKNGNVNYDTEIIFNRFIIKGNANGMTLTITKNEEVVLEEVSLLGSFTHLTKVEVSLGKSYAATAFDNMKLSVLGESEGISNPQISITAVDGISRTITITPGIGTVGTTAESTYYTTDGTDPSKENGTQYTEPVVISTTTTFKAISYLPDNGAVSEITTFEAEAGSTVSLSEDIIKFSFVANEGGTENVSVTNCYNNDGVLCSPEVTFSYTFNGTSITLPYIITEKGTLVATAIADGYTSTSEKYELYGEYQVKNHVDFTTTTVDNLTEVLGDIWSVNETNTRWANWEKTQGDIYNVAVSSSSNLTDFLYSKYGTNLLIGYGVGRNTDNGGTSFNIINPTEEDIALYEVNETRKLALPESYTEYVVTSNESPELAYNLIGNIVIAKVSVYAPVRELVINDTNDQTEYPDFAPEYSSYTSVVYNRKLNTGYTYGLICLPFVPDTESLENFQFYALSSAVNDKSITFEEVDVPEASRPYLYSIKEGASRTNCITGGYTTFDLTDPTAVKNFIANDNDTWELVGSLVNAPINCEIDPNANYAFNPVKSTLHKVNKTLTVYPYTAYVRNNAATSTATMRVYISGPTGIKEISRDDIEGFGTNGGMFDLQGRALSNPVKGQIYIENGVKKIKK